MEGEIIGALALLVGGLAVSGLCILPALWKNENNRTLWAISNSMERWIYGIGGILAALIGAVILFD